MLKIIICFMCFVLIIFSCGDQTNGKRIEKDYYEDGTIKLIIEYGTKEDSLLCGTRFYPTGKPHKKYCLLNGILEGDCKEYFENGKMMKSIFYSNGKIEKEAVFYHPNGNIKEKGNYKNNRKEGVISVYRQNGSLKARDYAVDDFVHYVELFDEEEQPRGIVNYIPRISIVEDSIYSGDTLSVKIEIPLPEDKFKLDSIYLNLDIGKRGERDSNLVYPQNIYSLEERVFTKHFLFNDIGDFMVYGHLLKGKGYDSHTYERFRVPFTALAKKDVK